MPDAPAPVRCDGCDQLGRRPLGHPAPHHWFYLESVDRTRGAMPGTVYTVWACSEACRDKLWQRGPGPNVVDEAGSERMRDRMEGKAVTAAIRYVHAGDLTTDAAHALEWKVGETNCRYQEIAIVGNRVVGAWTYDLEWKNGSHKIDSGRTDVTPRYRRKGVARSLWLAAVQRWQPTRIHTIISTDEGRDFVASMIAVLAFRAPGLWVDVKTRTEDDATWSDRCMWAAHELLNKLGKERPVLAETKPLKLLKGAAT